jgi:hypothetical protein
MTIFRGRPSFLVHLLLFSYLLRHLSFLGFVAVCPLFVCVPGIASCLCVVWSCKARPDNTQTGTPLLWLGIELLWLLWLGIELLLLMIIFERVYVTHSTGFVRWGLERTHQGSKH